MEPIPETAEAIDQLDPLVDGGDLLSQLRGRAEQVRAIVSDLLGLSLARLDHQLTFTLVATSEEIARLDAVQYLAGGPCVTGAESDEAREFHPDDPLDEERWGLFARATAAASVRSTLTLPIMQGQKVVGSLNLYAASPDSFEGHHEEIALVFDAWAPGAATNADLSFETRREAVLAPRRVRDRTVVDTAIGLISSLLRISLEQARLSLQDAADRAGVSITDLARTILDTRELPEGLQDLPRPDDETGPAGETR